MFSPQFLHNFENKRKQVMEKNPYLRKNFLSNEVIQLSNFLFVIIDIAKALGSKFRKIFL